MQLHNNVKVFHAGHACGVPPCLLCVTPSGPSMYIGGGDAECLYFIGFVFEGLFLDHCQLAFVGSNLFVKND